MVYVYHLFAVGAWVVGVVLAKGFWSTFFAVLIFPWAWYLTAEALLRHFGVIG